MKTFRELKAAAQAEAARHGDRIIDPLGVVDGKMVFYALPPGIHEGDIVGLPYAYWVDVRTGSACPFTNEECRLLVNKQFLESAEPMEE